MSGTTVASAAPGFYGKVLSRGDFVSRRLPQDFIDPWDRWLQRSLLEVEQSFGKRWIEEYVEAPIWRFALSAHVCSSAAWYGVVMPSVDRVGRYFPLTVAMRVNDELCAHHLLGVRGNAWFESVEHAMLNSLKDQSVLGEFETALENLDVRCMADEQADSAVMPHRHAGAATSAGAGSSVGAASFDCADAASVVYSDAASWECQFVRTGARPVHMGEAPGGAAGDELSVWWTRAHEVAPILNYGPLTSWLFINLL